MPYIIDGHNLIPKIPGINLQDLDDEQKLIDLLQDYARVSQVSLEVYFDRAPAGQAKTTQRGRVKVIFVTDKTIADERIIRRIRTLGNSASNWVVVTSDRRIQADAKESRAKSMSSEEFANMVAITLEKDRTRRSSDQKMSDTELDSWLKLFNQKK
jgi:predicted RNA-binding protein with PIN domain